MPAHLSTLLRVSGIFTATALALLPARADQPAKATTASSDEFPVFDNYVIVGGQYSAPSGDKSAFQSQSWTAKNGFGGIEDFRYSQEPSKSVSIEFDGHALIRNEDYLGHLHIAKDEVGSVDAGYKRFRTYYDGVGGFFPLDGAWFPLTSEDLHVDRSKLWVEGKLTIPNAPVVTLRYSYDTRTGKKDTTIWGDTDFTGIPILSNAALNPISANRKLVASYLHLDERHHQLEASVQQSFGQTRVIVSLIGDRIDNLDTRYLNRYPGEVKPYPAIPSNPAKLVDPSQANNAVLGYDQEGVKADTFAAVAKTETVFNDRLTLNTNLKFEHTTSSLTGYRPLWVNLSTIQGVGSYLGGYIAGGRAPGAYQDLLGSASVEGVKGNVELEFKATNSLYLEARLRGEETYTHASDSFVYDQALVNAKTSVVTPNPLNYSGRSSIKDTAWTPEIGFRYTGIKDLSFFGNADYRYAPGTEKTSYVTTAPDNNTDNVKENHGHYTVGANWSPIPLFTARAETFYKDHQNRFDGYGASAGSLNVLGYELYGAKLTATVRPLTNLSFTTRFITQRGTMDVTTDTAAEYQSMDAKSQQIGETVDWNPTRQIYVQASANFVFDTTSTAYPRAGGAGNNVLRNANNNYWTTTLVTGFALDKMTNLEAQYTHTSFDNYQPELAASTLPYGAGGREETVTVGVKRKITDRTLANVRVGYLDSRNDTSGGHTNFTAKIAYVSIEQAF